MIEQAYSQQLPQNRISPSQVPAIRRIGTDDLRAALMLGWDDFRAHPTQLFFLGIIYPVVAVILWKVSAGRGLLPLFYPLVSGFALIGPITAIGLYEISLRRERGQPASWRNCVDVRHSPALGSIIGLALILVAIFLLWMVTAQLLYHAAFGNLSVTLMSDFVERLFTTPGGWFLIVCGNLVGLAFACIVLGLTVVSFPMMLDRNADMRLAVRTSLQAMARNRLILALWGVIIGSLVMLGSLVAFVGLAVVLPVLGHAT